MKRIFLGLIIGIVAIAAVATTVRSSQQELDVASNLLNTNLEALTQGESGSGDCKWKLIDCPGWGTGDYEACLSNGDGYSCSCGSVTRDCK